MWSFAKEILFQVKSLKEKDFLDILQLVIQ
jgi:hypothetical protein